MYKDFVKKIAKVLLDFKDTKFSDKIRVIHKNEKNFFFGVSFFEKLTFNR